MIKPRSGAVRCLLVRPEFLEGTFYNPREMFQTLGAESAAPPLGLLTTAAYLPPTWELRFIDADLGPVRDEDLAWADVLMISGKGPQNIPIWRLIDRAQAHDVTVIVGGAGPTLQPRDYMGRGGVGRADYIVAGESEPVIDELLADLAKGVSKGIYKSAESASLVDARLPRWDLAELDRYMFVGMNFTRGCPFSCEFCAQIEIFGRKPRCKSPEQILAEHQRLYDLGYRGMIDLGYDNLIGDIPKTEAVLAAMRDWNREHGHPFFYSTEATMNLARQPKILELMRDNDFRYVFMGIESGDPAVLNRTKKGQNTAMAAEEAVRIVNSYGIVVNTGLIIGFDGESEQAAEMMLRMVQKTGAFPTLVLPLHALPGTQLARRLEAEKRLFGGGVVMNTEERTDTATTGLNFVTDRPRARVLGDLARVLEELYRPENHYERVALITDQLRAQRKFMPPPKKLLQLSRAFVKIARNLSKDPETARRFWPALARAAVKNPAAIEIVVGQAVMNDNYARSARSYVAALREQIAGLERSGDAAAAPAPA
ncbi:MAG: B12-binding domain-containing radical SAM protein [Sandaracinaceae bacterium]|nr:B12-binding domain-containing radical SAM protein [Sandaracinaceae bacterium]